MTRDDNTERADKSSPGATLVMRAVVLFLNFFLIILAYYQVKAASRSLVLEHFNPDAFPWLWIVTAAVLLTLIGAYHRMVERFERLDVVLASCVVFIVLLVGLRVWFSIHGPSAAVVFYILVDIFSVVLVEQFWSLTNTINSGSEGRRTYWFVATGGPVGGIVAGFVVGALIRHTPVTTPDLLLTCACFLALIIVLNLWMARLGMYREAGAASEAATLAGEGWRALLGSRYLILIAGMLLCAQLAQPVVEFQFLSVVDATFPEREARTAFIGDFFGYLNAASIAVNIVLTPLIHRYLGMLAGLLTQPLTLALFSSGFMAQPVLWMSGAMKIADRGLSYSINRASKELLYIPVDPVRVYQAKAWIDMLGYRLFKVLGSTAILFLVNVVGVGIGGLSVLTIANCVAWVLIIAMLGREYTRLTETVPAT